MNWRTFGGTTLHFISRMLPVLVQYIGFFRNLETLLHSAPITYLILSDRVSITGEVYSMVKESAPQCKSWLPNIRGLPNEGPPLNLPKIWGRPSQMWGRPSPPKKIAPSARNNPKKSRLRRELFRLLIMFLCVWGGRLRRPRKNHTF